MFFLINQQTVLLQGKSAPGEITYSELRSSTCYSQGQAVTFLWSGVDGTQLTQTMCKQSVSLQLSKQLLFFFFFFLLLWRHGQSVEFSLVRVLSSRQGVWAYLFFQRLGSKPLSTDIFGAMFVLKDNKSCGGSVNYKSLKLPQMPARMLLHHRPACRLNSFHKLKTGYNGDNKVSSITINTHTLYITLAAGSTYTHTHLHTPSFINVCQHI